jgi:hypothetical protein
MLQAASQPMEVLAEILSDAADSLQVTQPVRRSHRRGACLEHVSYAGTSTCWPALPIP